MGNNYVVNDLCKMVIEMGFRIKRTNPFYIAFSFCLVIVMLMITMMTVTQTAVVAHGVLKMNVPTMWILSKSECLGNRRLS